MLKNVKTYIYLGFILLFIQISPFVFAKGKDNPIKTKIHIVSKGDNLFDISKQYNCSVDDIKKWNHLKNNRLDIGQKLLVESEVISLDIKPSLEKPLLVTNSEAPPTKKYRTVDIAVKPKIYKVKSGDCLSKIADKNDISLAQLKQWNGLHNNKLSLGQKLFVSNPKPTKKVLDEKLEYVDNFNFSALLSDTVKNNPLFVNDTNHNLLMTHEQITMVDSIIDYAKTFLGLPYKYRGFGHQFDCSGYTMHVFSKFGIKLPPSSPGQAVIGEQIDKKNLRKGDLVFFKGSNSRNRRVGHVGMVVAVDNDSFTMIHSSTSHGITIERLNHSGFFARRYITARRVL